MPPERQATTSATRASMSSPATRARRPGRACISTATSTSCGPAPAGARIRSSRWRRKGASMAAVESLLDEQPDLPGTIELSGTVDEESGGYGGVHYLAERGWFTPPRVDHVIIPEPLNVDRICIGHRGVWWAEIETYGRMAHGSMPFLGDCAVRHMHAVIERFERELNTSTASADCAIASPMAPASSISRTNPTSTW